MRVGFESADLLNLVLLPGRKERPSADAERPSAILAPATVDPFLCHLLVPERCNPLVASCRLRKLDRDPLLRELKVVRLAPLELVYAESDEELWNDLVDARLLERELRLIAW
jgi:hypothetical protein